MIIWNKFIIYISYENNVSKNMLFISWQADKIRVILCRPTNCRGANPISTFSEWRTMRKKERRICRNQLSVILIGWGRCRKGRHCRNPCITECYC